MLRDVVFTLFLLKNIALSYPSEGVSCRTSSQTSLVEELARGNEFYQKRPPLDSPLKINGLSERSCYAESLQKLQKNSVQKVQELKNNKEFQKIVTELQTKLPTNTNASKNVTAENKAALLIFVSFSMGEKALLNLAYEAERFGATLILKGFKDGSYAKTVQALHKIILKTGQGVIVDPELYSLFEISAVPTFILTKSFQLQAGERAQTPIHDKVQGHVSTQYALEVIAKEGDLKEEARIILTNGEAP